MSLNGARSVHNEITDIAAIVDLDKYPLHFGVPPGRQEMLERCHTLLEKDGCCVLPNFIRPEAIEQIAAEGEMVAPEAYYQSETVNVYNIKIEQRLPVGHPAEVQFQRENAFVARDKIPPSHLIQKLYTNTFFQKFLADCFRLPKIHPLADPLAGLCLSVLKPGKSHPWHFDINEFTVSLLTRQAEEGGVFEYCPGIRGPDAENFSLVREVLDGKADDCIQQLGLHCGDLQLFCGRYSLHRVSSVEGERERHSAIFAYTQEAGVVGGLARTQQLFGRTLDVHTIAERATVRSDKLLD
ncbi:MAG: arpA protein [Cycloclasticus sp. symbiont of Poecilosclerida sp. N]|nr:MAG: arpA protein [Cycloclasticus sp. symbiont of Poecilosclerida sp. N]